MTKSDFFKVYFLRVGLSGVWVKILLVEVIAGALVVCAQYFSSHCYHLNLDFDRLFFWWRLSFDMMFVFWSVALALSKANGVKILSSLIYGREVRKQLGGVKAFCIDLKTELVVVVTSPTEVVETKKIQSNLSSLGEKVALSWGGSASAWQIVPGPFFSHAWCMTCRK